MTPDRSNRFRPLVKFTFCLLATIIITVFAVPNSLGQQGPDENLNPADTNELDAAQKTFKKQYAGGRRDLEHEFEVWQI